MSEEQADEAERVRRLLAAQARAIALFDAVTEAEILCPGRLDSDASTAIRELAAEKFGVERHWHKRIVRSGPNTLRPYQDNPPDHQMSDDEIVYTDFGPVFDDWEADLGRTWVLGDDPDKVRLRDDVEAVFNAGKRHFEAHPDLTAAALHAEVVRVTESLGWELGNFHCGHLVGEFPHENFDGAKVNSLLVPSNTSPIRRTDPSGRVAHWILEIHIVDRVRGNGAFFEQLLTC